MKKHSVIIDCDTGTDDAVAIIAALGSEELDIRAITTVCGNVDLAYTAANTLNLVRMLGFDTPVARGAERPLLRDITQLRASDKEAPGGLQLLPHSAVKNWISGRLPLSAVMWIWRTPRQIL